MGIFSDDDYWTNVNNDIIGLIMFCYDSGMQKSDIIKMTREEFALDFFDALHYVDSYYDSLQKNIDKYH